MVPEFFHFGYFPARNKLVVRQLVRKKVVAYYVRRARYPFWSAGASRPFPQKRGRRSRGSHDMPNMCKIFWSFLIVP